MKFNCGVTPNEKCALAEKKIEDTVKFLQEWHDFFAWMPVRIGSGDCLWLETVERKCRCNIYIGNIFFSEYRAKQ